MASRLILDTNDLIAYVRGEFEAASLDDDDLAIAAVTVAEFRTCIELAHAPARAADRARVLAVVTDTLTVLDYSARTAAEHARLIAHVRRTDTPCGAHNLIVRADAPEHGRTVTSLDATAKFGDLSGVQAIKP